MIRKKIYAVVLFCLLYTLSTFANNYETFKEQTENWLGTETWLQEKATNGPPEIGGELSGPNPTVTPLAGETAVLLGLGLAYGFYVLRSRKRQFK